MVSILGSCNSCYFFFKDGFEDQISATSALCCILHQLFKQKPALLSDATLGRFNATGDAFTASFSGLWQALINAAKDQGAGEIICVLDAIDECESRGWTQLSKAFCSLYSTNINFNLKFLLTSRPYDGIRRSFQRLDLPGLPVIHLSGESDSELEKIAREIGIFIQARVQEVGTQLALTKNERNILLDQLFHVPNRTYLWVHLTLDLIENSVRVDRHHIINATSQLPQTVDEAYDKILSKSADPGMAVKMLHIIAAAARPLTVSEMNVVFALYDGHRSYDDLGLGPEERFRRDVRQICGLFVTIIGSKIYLLHQTAREFLVPTIKACASELATGVLRWKYSLKPQESHQTLPSICIQHLLFGEFEINHLGANDSPSQYAEQYAVLG